MKKIDISVIIPLRNEEKNIWPLYKTIKETLLPLQKSYEIIFIDDGSTDNSFKVLKKIFDENTDNSTIISFRGKYGKSAALACGFKKACGDIIFTMDADLQDDTQYIKPMLTKLSEGYDLVCGWRAKRKDPLLKVFLSRIFNITISFASGIKIHDFNCGFKAYKKEVTKELRLYGDLHRYIPVLVHWKNFKVTELKIAHHPRKFGKTKYGKERIIGGFLDFLTVMFLTKYYEKPSRFFGASGIVLSGSGFLILTYLIVGHVLCLLRGIKELEIRERPLLTMSVLLILIGFQMFSIGLIAEMINVSQKNRNNEEVYEIRTIFSAEEKTS